MRYAKGVSNEMISEKSRELKKAVCVLAHLSEDEKTRLLSEEREKARRDYKSGIEGAFVEGKLEGKIEAVVKLIIELKMDIDMAMKIIELDEGYRKQVVEKLNEKSDL